MYILPFTLSSLILNYYNHVENNAIINSRINEFNLWYTQTVEDINRT